MSPDPHSELLQRARQGEPAAQRALYEQHAAAVLGTCVRYARNRSEADDFAQATWMQVLTHLDQFRASGPFVGWLRQVTITTCLQQLRQQARRETATLPEVSAACPELVEGKGYYINATAVEDLAADELIGLIQQLPPRSRAVFNLVAVEGYSHAETGEQLSISANASRSLLKRARAMLQAAVDKLSVLCI